MKTSPVHSLIKAAGAVNGKELMCISMVVRDGSRILKRGPKYVRGGGGGGENSKIGSYQR